MPASSLVTVTEYLASRYRPDREYLDGVLLERNVGEWDHSWLQALLMQRLFRYEQTLGLLVVPEQRVQVRAARFRVPDICALLGKPGEQILTRPPYLVIEILSPEDSISGMRERIEDYLQFEIPNVWLVNPRMRKAYWADVSGLHEAAGGLQTTDSRVAVDIANVFQEL